MMRGRLETWCCGLLAPAFAVACSAGGSGEKRRDDAVPDGVKQAEAEPGERRGQAGQGAAPAGASETPHLAGPSLTEWQPVLRPASITSGHYDGYSHVAVITGLEVDLYPDPGARWGIGLARLGTRLPARPASGKGCSGGSWYQVAGGAYLCSATGVHLAEYPLTDTVLSEEDQTRRADLRAPNPFRYAKAVRDAPLLVRLPSAEEAEALGERRSVGGVVKLWLDGTYLMALGREIEHGGATYYETIEGYFLREADIQEWKGTSTMHGEHLGESNGGESNGGESIDLPLAFALDDAELYCVDGDAAEVCGKAERQGRFQVARTVKAGGTELAVAADGTALRRDGVRVAERIDRPEGVPEGGKWMHINLSEQTLVAYEGDTPVFATLVSSGKRAYATPTGLWQVQRKYVTKTMRGKDEAGPYEVQEVPWAMYYDGNYAVHGAYWHDNFGNTRSHGCTNLPSPDARWLYLWSEPELPAGWHAMFHRRGAHVYITGKTPPDNE